MPFPFGHLVIAVFLQPGLSLFARETGLRVRVERRERIGDRRGNDVRSFFM